MTGEPNNLENIARVCHEANRAWCLALGDTSQPLWEDAPDWQRASAIQGVMTALTGASPEEMHMNWCAVKIDAGWVHGDVKNPDAKTHPCLVPYDQLPEEQQRKDHLFSAVVGALR